MIRHKVREASNGDANLAGSIIADAFADDPVNQWAFGNRAMMEPVYQRLAKFTYLTHGFGHLVEERADHAPGTDARTSLGAALWLPPGGNRDTALLHTASLAFAFLARGAMRSAFRSLALERAETEHRPAEPHYYLFAIGVRPQYQGQGLGRALFAPALERCDKEAMPAWLESSKETNIPFYRSHGFEVVRKITPAPGCPPMWLMWREPK